MTYRDNVTALATKLGISNEPRLREVDIEVIQVSFIHSDGSVTNIEATPMNQAGRLFFQAVATKNGDWYGIQEMTVALREEAQEYFAELWEPNPVHGKRKMLDAFRDPLTVEICIMKKRARFA